MPQLERLLRPGSLSEAFSLLTEHGERARPLAGGTSLVLSGSRKTDTLIDLGRLGLEGIALKESTLRIGAMARCATLRRFLGARGAATDVLYEAAHALGSRVLQNHVTVGGNSVMVYAWSDLPVALLCLEADFLVQSGRIDQPRVITADAFFAQHPSRVLAADELLLEVRVPWGDGAGGSAYRKFSLNETDQALCSVAARIVLEQGRVAKSRIVVGAVRGGPQVAAQASATLTGGAPSPERLTDAANVAATEVNVVNDPKASADYRRQLVRTLVEDALSLVVERAASARGAK